MSSYFPYAQLPAFKYHTFDKNAVQYTHSPLLRPPSPHLVEENPEPEIVDQADNEIVGDDQAGDDAGKILSFFVYSRCHSD